MLQFIWTSKIKTPFLQLTMYSSESLGAKSKSLHAFSEIKALVYS